MADQNQPSSELVTAVSRAHAVIASHPQVERADPPLVQADVIQIELLIDVPMPNAWRAAGVSPSGVNRYEPVRLDFPPRFPIDPPEVSLRSDFRRDLAHIQPWLTSDERPVPCIQDGKLPEFMQQQGMVGILNQTIAWLEHAAEGRLIDPDQGWEPQRRDDFCECLVADASSLRELVTRDGGFRFNRMDYFRKKGYWLHGQVFNNQVPLNEKSIKSAIRWLHGNDGYQRGQSLALIVWPGKQPSGAAIVCDAYQPDTISDLGGLKRKAREFGCLKELNDGLNRLAQCVKDFIANEEPVNKSV